MLKRSVLPALVLFASLATPSFAEEIIPAWKKNDHLWFLMERTEGLFYSHERSAFPIPLMREDCLARTGRDPEDDRVVRYCVNHTVGMKIVSSQSNMGTNQD